ncbi:MAG TPA: glycoside hydrolase family 99-like domain-containing protein, partial [Flavitalea sp.]|nr:glycoside hydrolase family 99-like domain-containing protein [Flavitalea sp.]
IPTIIPQWDRSPRRQSAIIYKKSSPEIFSQHLQNALDIISRKEENARILILKSWNEWGEGNYMEPDRYNGHGYLNALKEKIFY